MHYSLPNELSSWGQSYHYFISLDFAQINLFEVVKYMLLE